MKAIQSALTLLMLVPFLVIVKCDNCNDCAATGRIYACLDEFTYGACYDTDFVDPGSINPCPDGYYCNIEGLLFCTPSDTTTPSCSSDTESSTPTPEINPDKYCRDLNKTGQFRVESDPTCKDYVYCYLLSGDYLGWLYHCNTNEYYNSKTAKCVTTRPDDC